MRKLLSRRWVRASALLVLTLAAYAPALRCAFIWDDDAHVTSNAALQSRDGLRRIWLTPTALPQYYPLVHTTFWIEHHLWGDAPLGYHLVNVLLHGAAAVVLLFLLELLAVPGAWLAAAIFALHPLNVESVAWVTERKNVLSGVLYLAAGLCYLTFAGIDARKERGARRGRWYAASIALFLCALLSKTVAATLPVALLIVLWWKRDRLGAADVAPLGPFVLLGVVLGSATVWLERHHVGAEGAAWSLTLGQRFFVAGRALWFYAGKIVWPVGLTFVYPRWAIGAADPVGMACLVAAVAVIVGLAWCRARIGKGPLTAALYFVTALSPALGFFNIFPMVFSWVADHFQYLAGIGPIAGISAGMVLSLRNRGASTRRAAIAIAAGLIAVLGSLTWTRAHAYKDAETLWLDTLARNPAAWSAHQNLGVILAARGDDAGAEGHYRAALAIDGGYAPAHFALAHALLNQGKLAEAETLCREEEVLWPTAQLTHENAAVLALLRGNSADAEQRLRETIRLFPDSATARINLASVLIGQGRRDEARAQFDAITAIVGARQSARLHDNLGLVLAKQGKPAHADAQFAEALKLDPGFAEARLHLAMAHRQLAAIFYGQGDAAKAEMMLREALRVLPTYADAEADLARVARITGSPEASPAPSGERRPGSSSPP